MISGANATDMRLSTLGATFTELPRTCCVGDDIFTEMRVESTDPDGRYTLKEGECMGACGHGPLCLHNNHKMHDHLTPESVDKLLDDMK